MGWFDSPDGTKFFEFVIFEIEYFGLACTKAGGTPLQGDRGGFDSLRVHKNTIFMVGIVFNGQVTQMV